MNKSTKRKHSSTDNRRVHFECDNETNKNDTNPLFSEYYHSSGITMNENELENIFINGMVKLYTKSICKKMNIDSDFDYVKNFYRFSQDDFTFDELKLYTQLSICKHSTKFNSEQSTFLKTPDMATFVSIVTSSDTYSDFIYKCYKHGTNRPISNHAYNDFMDDGIISSLKFSNLYTEFQKLKDDLSLESSSMCKQLFPLNITKNYFSKNTQLVNLGKIYLRWSNILKHKNTFSSNSKKVHMIKFIDVLQSLFLKCVTDYVNRSLLCILFQFYHNPTNQLKSHLREFDTCFDSINKSKEILLMPVLHWETRDIELPCDVLAEVLLYDTY